MKIIEKKDYTNWCYPFTCGECESRLEAEAIDVIAVYHENDNDPRGSSPAYWSYEVRCVVCNHSLHIAEKDVPQGLRTAAQRRNNHVRSNHYHDDR